MRVTLNENPRLEYLREKTLRLTSSPGCYIMKNKSGNIIYIGKAKNLRNRVSTYSFKLIKINESVMKSIFYIYKYFRIFHIYF